MNRLCVLVFLLLTTMLSAWSEPREDRKLVVFLVIDQLHQDHLSIYRDYLLPPDKGGFRLLAERGKEHTRAFLDHYPAHTASGHATLSTGALPSVHGVVGNRWVHPGERIAKEAGTDRNYPLIQGKTAGFSPVTLMAPTIGDTFLRATGGASKIASVSVKNRVATLTAGRAAETALWLDMGSGNWTTSRYYAPDGKLSEYVEKWNQDHHPDQQFPLTWAPRFLPELGKPASIRDGSLRSGYAGDYMSFGDHFPHVLDGGQKQPSKDYYTAWSHTPDAVQATFELALQTLDHYDMGRDNVPDILFVGISGMDKIGHIFGPDAPESFEMLMEIDHSLADFFSRLDQKVGLENCMIALTSDHGSQPLVEYLQELGTDSRTILLAELKSRLRRRLEQRWSPEQFLLVFSDPHVWLKPAPGFESERPAMVAELKAELESLEGVHSALDREALLKGEYRPGTYEEIVARSIYAKRSGDLMVIPQPNTWVGFRGPGGTNHGSPWNYDRHVPLLLYGWPGASGEEIRTVAPRQVISSICHYFGFSPPAGCEADLLPWVAQTR